MAITASKLRENVYQILDEVIATGTPVEITRKGHTLRIVAEKKPSKLSRLTKRPGVVVGDIDDLVHIDWLKEWSEMK